MNWEELKEESENLIKKDGFVAIEKDEWKWIVDTIESLALENVRLKDEIEKKEKVKSNGINHKAREAFESEPILNVEDLMETAYKMKVRDDFLKSLECVAKENRHSWGEDPIKDIEEMKRICMDRKN